MTPKAKAKELIDKYTNLEIEIGVEFDGYLTMKSHNAKECAMIVVDEIIDEHNSYYDTIGESLARIKYCFWKDVRNELELYRFIEDNDIEWRHEDNNGNKDIIIFMYPFQLESFVKLVKNIEFDEGIDMVLRHGYLAVFIQEVCEYFDIETENVFKI